MDGDAGMSIYTISHEEHLFGYPIGYTATVLDDGLHVLLTGGCRTHIGAISVADPGQGLQTILFPGHKDQLISDHWAETLSARFHTRCCVVCGIHYDHATPAQLQEITVCCNRLLTRLFSDLPF